MRCSFGVWLRRFILVVVAVVGFSPGISLAEVPAIPQMSQEKDEYDFSWLDPEKKIYVVQNRKYTKAKKLELALGAGIGIGEPYRSRTTFMPRGVFYFSEHWGAEIVAGFNSNSENTNFQNLKAVSSRIPTVRDIQQFVGGSIVWLPFYGKLNMFNHVFYFDWHMSAGLSSVNSEIDLNTSNTGAPRIQEDTFTGFNLGTGMKFFVTRNFGVRLDYLSIFYKAPIALSGSTTDGLDDTYDNHFLTLGVSYTF